MSSYLIHAVRFIALILFQVLIINNIRIGGYVNPFVYVLFILLLPFNIKPWVLLMLGFVTGFTIDIFSLTPGLHTGATVLLAYMRPVIIRLTIGPRDPEGTLNPGLHDLGARWFFTYSVLLVTLHHFALFLLEVFSFYHFGDIVLRTLYSVVFTEILIMVLLLLFSKGKK
ncbi:MAG: rod shape-determining protein MreD [Bacteroidales bacterium]|nr:rod shape-determining protein MreD [Bacteroidales bacterium]